MNAQINQPVESSAQPQTPAAPLVRESFAPEYTARLRIAESVHAAVESGQTVAQAARALGVHYAKAYRYMQEFRLGGREALRPGYNRCGRKPGYRLTETEIDTLRRIYLATNRTRNDGSMRTAAKMLALDPATTDDTRFTILRHIENHSTVPTCIKRVLESIGQCHFGQVRRPRMNRVEQFSGEVGARVEDKIQRRRVVESDDGTINFVVNVPWEVGGDACSDKFGVRPCRAQWLPQIEAGWSHMVLGYSLVFRPRGSYRGDDIRECIYRTATVHGFPDCYRFEHGAWESDRILEMLEQSGVELETVDTPNAKATIEGFFNKMWTYLSTIEGQVGRYRGEHEAENSLLVACREGRQDPRRHFPMLRDAVLALDGAVHLHNTDTIDSLYGRWIPMVRHDQLKETRPWPALAPELDYLFQPVRREWTVCKGSVGGTLPVFDNYAPPFYFAHQDLWRWNGRKVSLYFDPLAQDCRATVVSQDDSLGCKPGDVICIAPLIGELPSYTRAAIGWAERAEYKPAWRNAALAALRRETRVIQGDRTVAAVSESSDGRGTFSRATVGLESQTAVRQPSARQRSAAPRPDLPTVTESLEVSPRRGLQPEPATEVESIDSEPVRRRVLVEETETL